MIIHRAHTNKLHSANPKRVQGKCPLHFVNFNGAVCLNTLFLNTKVLEHLVGRTLLGSNFGGLLLEHTFCRCTLQPSSNPGDLFLVCDEYTHTHFFGYQYSKGVCSGKDQARTSCKRRESLTLSSSYAESQKRQLNR